MIKLISQCPSCGGDLQITVLHCPDCGMELRNEFALSPFDLLKKDQMDFLMIFLQQQGNMSAVQQALQISYPTAKKRLEEVLTALHLTEKNDTKEQEEVLDMSNWTIPKDSIKASDIIKQKLMEQGGKAIVYTVRNLPCDIQAAPDGKSFLSKKLPVREPYRYEVFDIIVSLLLSQGGRAQKGNGRNYRLGEPLCDETTVVGAIGYRYWKAEEGKSVYDPVFVLAAVLEWAGIAKNCRGELVLTAHYLQKYQEAMQKA